VVDVRSLKEGGGKGIIGWGKRKTHKEEVGATAGPSKLDAGERKKKKTPTLL